MEKLTFSKVLNDFIYVDYDCIYAKHTDLYFLRDEKYIRLTDKEFYIFNQEGNFCNADWE